MDFEFMFIILFTVILTENRRQNTTQRKES